MAGIKLFILGTHNILRWVIVLLAIYSLFRLITGWVSKKSWTLKDQKSVTYLVISLDLQLIFGLLLYFVFSDITKAAFADFGSAMSNQVLRFFTLEHSLMMAAGIVLVHLANTVGKKNLPDQKKWTRVTIMIGVALLLILAGIPWKRPLLQVF